MLCWGISWSILVVNVFSWCAHLPKGLFAYNESKSDSLDILWYSTWMHCIISMSWRGWCLYWEHMNMRMLRKESCYSWGSLAYEVSSFLGCAASLHWYMCYAFSIIMCSACKSFYSVLVILEPIFWFDCLCW